MIERQGGLLAAALKGLRGRCPNCGQGKLFRAYLKPVDCCDACGHNWSEVRADDGPAWLSILVVGHIVVPLTVLMLTYEWLPDWGIIASICALTTVLTLAVLPLAKGAFIAAIWSLNAEHS
jgi:uncharacterized protein (DUF983 family)